MSFVFHTGGRHYEISTVNAVAAIKAYPRKLKLWLLLCFALMGVSVIGALAALPVGWEVMGTSPTMEWGLLIAGYVVLAITTSGLCLSVSMGTVLGIKSMLPLERRGVIMAFVCLAAAFGTILLDLQYPLRLVFGAVLSPSPHSPMWWMGLAYAGYLMILLVELATMYTRFHTLHKWAATAAFVMAMIAPATLGTVFGSIQAHSLWHGVWTPIQMLVTAFSAGLSVMAMMAAIIVRFQRGGFEKVQDRSMQTIQRVLGFVLVVIAVLLMRQIVGGLTSDTRGLAAATRTIVSGPFSIPFWTIRVGFGIVLPILLLLGPATKKWWAMGLAGFGGFIGVVADRLIFVVAGLASPVSTVAGNADFPFAVYIPSLIEVLIMVGAFATIAAAYSLIEQHFLLTEPDHHGDYGIRRFLARRKVEEVEA